MFVSFATQTLIDCFVQIFINFFQSLLAMGNGHCGLQCGLYSNVMQHSLASARLTFDSDLFGTLRLAIGFRKRRSTTRAWYRVLLDSRPIRTPRDESPSNPACSTSSVKFYRHRNILGFSGLNFSSRSAPPSWISLGPVE